MKLAMPTVLHLYQAVPQLGSPVGHNKFCLFPLPLPQVICQVRGRACLRLSFFGAHLISRRWLQLRESTTVNRGVYDDLEMMARLCSFNCVYCFLRVFVFLISFSITHFSRFFPVCF